MSNYPPGVTGNEPAIAGYPESEHNRTCGRDDTIERSTISQHQMHKLVGLQGDLGRLTNLARKLRDAPLASRAETWFTDELLGVEVLAQDAYNILASGVRGHEDLTLDEGCPFSGVVTVYYVNGDEVWNCPLCGYEHITPMGEEI